VYYSVCRDETRRERRRREEKKGIREIKQKSRKDEGNEDIKI
jgi:hypothetical protein